MPGLSGYAQVGPEAAVYDAASVQAPHQELVLEVAKVDARAKYVLVELSQEEEGVEVYFDDVQLLTSSPELVQENHYDPWGLNLAGIEKQGAPDHRWQYNSKEKQPELGLNWNDHGARMYDIQTGRWTTVDPLAEANQESWSPYHFGFNNPVRYNDLDGRMPGEGNGDDPTKGKLSVTAAITWGSVAMQLEGVGVTYGNREFDVIGIRDNKFVIMGTEFGGGPSKERNVMGLDVGLGGERQRVFENGVAVENKTSIKVGLGPYASTVETTENLKTGTTSKEMKAGVGVKAAVLGGFDLNIEHSSPVVEKRAPSIDKSKPAILGQNPKALSVGNRESKSSSTNGSRTSRIQSETKINQGESDKIRGFLKPFN